MEIKVNLTAIEKVLAEVIEKAYKHLGETYLVIEELRVYTEDLEETTPELEKFNYSIIGRYGIEGKLDLEKRFDFIAESTWNYNYLAGYFACIVDEQDGVK